MFLLLEDAAVNVQCPGAGLLAALRREAETNPALVLACAGGVHGEARRDAVMERAFLAAARGFPALAKRYLDVVVARPWAGNVPLPLAIALGDRRLVMAAVRAHPSVAIREADALARFGLLEEAVRLIPGEALGIAVAGSSARAARLREMLPERLRALLKREDLDLPLRQRVAWLGEMPVEEALRIARDDRTYFARIAGLEREAAPFAERWFLEAKQHGVKARMAALRGWAPRELYSLLVEGRGQVDKPLFQTFFDSLLKGRLKAWREWPQRRRFVRDAAVYGRLRELPREMVAEALDGPLQYEDMLLGAEVAEMLALQLDGVREPAPAKDAWMQQRHYFYDDEDGRESFASFRKAYREGGWSWTERDGRVTLRKGAMRIEANAPGREFASEGTPGVVVHRGHEFHVPKTLAVLPASVTFVFLGSCRGMGSVGEVLRLAPRADVLVTRATGSHTVNDPLLKALNEAALQGGVQWDVFWRNQQERFRGNALFAEYVPPHRNAAAYVIKAHQRYLTDEHAPAVDVIFARWRAEYEAR